MESAGLLDWLYQPSAAAGRAVYHYLFVDSYVMVDMAKPLTT